MRFQTLLLTTILSFSVIFAASCSGEVGNGTTNTTNVTVNANTAQSPAANNAGNPLATNKAPEAATVNQAETVTPVVKAYCDAMTKKDEAAIRKVYSQSTIKSLEEDMKADGKKSLIEYLTAIDQTTNKLCEARNEKVEGETAVAEIRTASAPNGVKIKFIRENGEWKMTNEYPDFDNKIKNAPPSNSNTAK